MDLRDLQLEFPAQKFELREVRDHMYQLIAPIFHEDGDMMTIFLEEIDSETIRLSDQGMALMRLSYLFDINTDNKRRILNDTIAAWNGENLNGSISLCVKKKNLFSGIMAFSQLMAQIENLSVLSHENVSSLFYENVSAAIDNMKLPFNYTKDYKVPGLAECQVDFAFFPSEHKPIYLFAVKDTNKAQQAAICCLQFTVNKVWCRSAVVFESLDTISKFARNHLINCVGKVFPDLEGFKEKGKDYFEELIAG